MNIAYRTLPKLMAAIAISAGQLLAQEVASRADRDLPKVPAGFVVSLFAREPLVRQPCSLAFDAQGRLYVGMGPQYRMPKPETPGDSVVLVLDTNGDGTADATKVFATGFNAVQGLAWHGRDLWVANAPDLTVVRDLDGDDEADEYTLVYTDLGNLEHGLHGLVWAPDGKLYMSKGNSKGLTKPGRIAPKPFRELWGVTAPFGSPDFPPPQTFRKDEYRHAYHDPADDWGREGGVLRCDDGGKNLEIVARGFRNPWDITTDGGFNWLGTDNDQTTGDRVFMPFRGAHFGWNHAWSSHWSDEPHSPTAPVSGPLFEGSGTGIAFYDAPQFPPAYRGVFFINDWLRKTTFVWRPAWDGALLRPAGGTWEPFAEGGPALFRPTDLEIGPDGALWILGWSSGYGAEWSDGKLSNQGRIFRIASQGAAPPQMPTKNADLRKRTVADLVADFAGPLPVWRIDAQDELVRCGAAVEDALIAELQSGKLTEMQETWTAWALGRIVPESDQIDREITDRFVRWLAADSTAPLNLRIQSVRILAHRVREFRRSKSLPGEVASLLRSPEPRLRFAAVQAFAAARQRDAVPDLLAHLAGETDPTTFYAGWQALRELSTADELRPLLTDGRAGVRRAALLALLESGALKAEEIRPLSGDADANVRDVVALRLGGGAKPASSGRQVAKPQRPASTSIPSLARQLKVRSSGRYQCLPGGFVPGELVYSDRAYRLKDVPESLLGAELLQTANQDDGSRAGDWLSLEALVPVRILVGIDTRLPQPPNWIRERFRRTDELLVTDDCTVRLFTCDFPAGMVTLGGNTDDGKSGGKSNYVIALQPQPFTQRPETTTIEQTLAVLDRGDAGRGELLFRHPALAACAKCHSLDDTRNGFGPHLGSIGLRAAARHLVESIVAPSALITEGFALQVVRTEGGQTHSGVLLEESGLSLTLGLATGERLVLPKSSIEARKSDRVSAMPSLAPLLAPEQVADLTAFLLAQKRSVAAAPQQAAPPQTAPPAKVVPANRDLGRFTIDEKPDRLHIRHAERPVATFVFKDEKILRPFFAHLFAPGGAQVTRNHPPIAGRDATDHDTMHPGLWLAFGNLSGDDFWRNRGRIEHLRFSEPPAAKGDQLDFATDSQVVAAGGETLGSLASRFTLALREHGWLVVWDATFQAGDRGLTFGDQEEMGFGARVATPLTEKAGGILVNSHGVKSAAKTWGQPALWCDYSGPAAERRGITLLPDPANFRESWWHNRDYGVFVANPFGRAAMRQGPASKVEVKPGESFHLRFAAALHDAADYDPAAAYQDFLAWLRSPAAERRAGSQEDR